MLRSTHAENREKSFWAWEGDAPAPLPFARASPDAADVAGGGEAAEPHRAWSQARHRVHQEAGALPPGTD
ncbi:hypothetical protein STIAU_0514 [Stigmatella aurantiaca DW4/3-1]|uniref:Uncharacterized protein n=1 Tax=Stigmatella aurantiaca (strain DW4/3-1) TaxID=378806 RepID=Q094J7_STIAD|nr:hypothetical protein STIAU_0514 [Stigmatella aurantiaca DW4/3-1]